MLKQDKLKETALEVSPQEQSNEKLSKLLNANFNNSDFKIRVKFLDQ